MEISGSDIEKVYQVDYWNGFGFQYEPSLKCFYIAKVKNDFKIPAQFSPDDVWLTDHLGYEFLTISLEIYESIPVIFNAILEQGNGFVTHTRPPVWFPPGTTFSRRDFELFMILQAREKCDLIGKGWAIFLQIEPRYETMLSHWNWATQEGREFCSELRKELHLPKRAKEIPRMLWEEYERVTRENEILHCGGWGAYEPDLGGAETPKKKVKDDGEECYICMDRKANTFVLPCMHCVVCKECSEKLKETNDAKICVRCRNPIEEVLTE